MCNFQWENHFFPFSRYDKQKMTAQLILSIHFFIPFFLFVRTPADHHLHLSHIIMQFVFDYQAYGVYARVCICICVSVYHCVVFPLVYLPSSAFTCIRRCSERTNSPNNTTRFALFCSCLYSFLYIFMGLFYLT